MKQIDFTFKNINTSTEKKPTLAVVVNDVKLLEAEVKTSMSTQFTERSGNNLLQVYFVNKQDSDTITDDQQNIMKDMNFELESIVIDGVDIKELVWGGTYVTAKEKIDSCLFFGPKGHFELQFEMPVLRWTLEQNHLKNGNDPNWQEDYNNYTEAWKRLNQN
jgi:hypothetical protein